MLIRSSGSHQWLQVRSNGCNEKQLAVRTVLGRFEAEWQPVNLNCSAWGHLVICASGAAPVRLARPLIPGRKWRALLHDLSSFCPHCAVGRAVLISPCKCRATPDGLLFWCGLQMTSVDESNGIEMV